MNYYISNIDVLRKKFFEQLQQEYLAFQCCIMAQSKEFVYDNSLKITFYREVFTYLNNDVLHDKEYESFADDKTIERLWDIYVVSELPRQTRDYLRQLINIYRENKTRRNNDQL